MCLTGKTNKNQDRKIIIKWYLKQLDFLYLNKNKLYVKQS